MSVSLVGSIGKTSGTASPLTGVYGQTPTAGNSLLALIAAGSQTLEVGDITTSTTGWAHIGPGTVCMVSPGGGNTYVMVDAWAKATAAGSDTAPAFSQTLGSTGKELTCYILELNGADTSSLLDTSAIDQAGGPTTITFSLSSSAHVAASGEFAVTISAMLSGTSTTRTWTETGTGWTSGGVLPSGSSGLQSQLNYQANPTSGATLTDAGHFSSNSTAYGAALMIVISAAAEIITCTGAVKFKKFSVAGTSSEKSQVNAAVKFKKVKLSGTSAEKSAMTAAVKFKKITLSGMAGGKSAGSAAVKFKKIKIVASSVPHTFGNGTVKFKKFKIAVSAGLHPALAVAIKFKKFRLGGAGSVVVNARVSWDSLEHFYTTGVSNGVLYPKNSPGVAWNGLISVTEKGDPAVTPFFVDGQLYRSRYVPDAFSGTISAYMYPDEFNPYIGVVKGISSQVKPTFGLTYRNNREIHLVWNVLVSPSSDHYVSTGGDIDPNAFSWDFTTLPEDILYARPSAHLVVNTDEAYSDAIAALEDILYGNDANAASLPSPADVISLIESFAVVVVTDNGDGTWTATGPDDVITITGDIFSIDWPSAIFTDADDYQISSL